MDTRPAIEYVRNGACPGRLKCSNEWNGEIPKKRELKKRQTATPTAPVGAELCRDTEQLSLLCRQDAPPQFC